MMTRALAILVLAVCAQGQPETTVTRGLGLDRLPAVLEAITETATGATTAEPTTFADLWGRPEASDGRLVRVRGVVRRRFRQGPVGAFPALAETWITDDRNQPLVLLSPANDTDPPLGAAVEFSGRFLGLVRYRGADTDRLAPLVAGPNRPAEAALRADVPPSLPTSSQEWAVGAILAGIAMGLIALVHLRAPRVRSTITGPPPVFIDPNADDEKGREP
jgi:hypothetical protein